MRKPLWYKRLIIFLPVLFAHKPTCQAFRKDLFCIKGIYLCRSCSFLVLGFLLGVLSISFFDLTQYVLYIYLSIVIGGVIFILSHPKLYKTLPRLIKDWVRFFLGWSIANFLFLLIFKRFLLFTLALSLLFILRLVYSEIRGKMKGKACDKCNEYYQDKLCSGFLLKAGLMKKYEDEVCRVFNK